MKRLIVYGDIHGCYDELVELRKKIKPCFGDLEVCTGDFITRGKKSIETLRYLQKNNIKSVIGNHEDKIIRYLNHEKSIKKNPVKLNKDEEKIVKRLNSRDINFLYSLPLFMKFGKITIIHAGLQNQYNLDNLSKSEKSKILRLRFVTKDNKFIPFGEENSDSVFWSDIYDGKQGFVIYGHQWFDSVNIDTNSLGIDTGCVYGNKLSGAVFNSPDNHKLYKIFSTRGANNPAV